jgi:hypothetical protein
MAMMAMMGRRVVMLAMLTMMPTLVMMLLRMLMMGEVSGGHRGP